MSRGLGFGLGGLRLWGISNKDDFQDAGVGKDCFHDFGQQIYIGAYPMHKVPLTSFLSDQG